MSESTAVGDRKPLWERTCPRTGLTEKLRGQVRSHRGSGLASNIRLGQGGDYPSGAKRCQASRGVGVLSGRDQIHRLPTAIPAITAYSQ